MNALKTKPAAAPAAPKKAPRLHIVPATPAFVDAPQSCALVDLIRINECDRVILVDDLRRIARAAVFVPMFCWLAAVHELMGAEASA